MKIVGLVRTGIAIIILAAKLPAVADAQQANPASLSFTELSPVTYGISATARLGIKSHVTSLLYTSSPQQPKRRFSDLPDPIRPQFTASSAKSGSMMVEDAEITVGSVGIKLGYQDISKDFSGFAAMRGSNVAPADVLNQLEKEKGMKRMNVAVLFGPTGSNQVSAGTIRDGKGDISTRALSYAGKGYGVSVYKRSVDKSFSRLGDLSTQDRNDMALAVRRQFDPNASVEQVTDADRAAVSGDAGIDRTSIRANFTAGSVNSTVQSLNISDGEGGIRRSSISFAGKDFSVSWMRQSIGQRFGRLGSLAPIEKGEFGNEYGMDRMMFAGSGTVGGLNLGLSFSKVSDGQGSATKQGLSVKGKSFDVKANIQNIDPSFSRSMDLVDADKKQMAEDRGYRKTDISGNFKLSNSVGVESFYMRGHNESEGKDKSQIRNKVTFTPNGRTRITAFRDQFSFRSDQGNIQSYVHQSLGIDQKIGAFQFSGVRDTNSVTTGNQEQTTTTTSMHLESDKNARNWLSLDSRRIDYGDGRGENLRAFSFVTRPMGTMGLRMSMMDIAREGGADESARNVGLDWNVRKDIKITADVTTKNVENAGTTNTSSYAVVGKVADNMLGMKDVKASAQFSKETVDGATKKENNRVCMDAQLAGGSVSMEMLHGVAPNGNPTGGSGFRFVSNRDPKRWLHFDLGYGTRDLGDGHPFAIRNLNFDMRLNAKTSLTGSYFTYTPKPDGTYDPKGGKVIKLTTALNKTLNLAAEYGTSQDYATGCDGVRMGLGIIGKLSNGADVELYFGTSDLSGPSGGTSETYRLKYDHKVDADHYLSFSGILETQKDHNPATADKSDFQGRLDFKTLFH